MLKLSAPRALLLAGASLLVASTSVAQTGPRPAAGMVVATSQNDFETTWSQLIAAIDASPARVVRTVDHSAAAIAAGLSLPPTRLVIFGNPNLGTPFMLAEQTAGIDLPQKIIVWQSGSQVFVGYNSVDYIETRHDVANIGTAATIAGALQNFTAAATGSQASRAGGVPFWIRWFDGLRTVRSRDDFTTTLDRLRAAIDASPANIALELDHSANAASIGQTLRPTTLLVFGNPNLGTPLMARSRSAAIDLPLKILVWVDSRGTTRVTYNSTFFLALRHGLFREWRTLRQIDDAVNGFVRTAVGSRR